MSKESGESSCLLVGALCGLGVFGSRHAYEATKKTLGDVVSKLDPDDSKQARASELLVEADNLLADSNDKCIIAGNLVAAAIALLRDASHPLPPWFHLLKKES
jgi:hypothetical protein